MLKQKDQALNDWLDDAQANGEKVVYVSLGSIAKWRPWSVKVMYEGLKKVGCRVIWSMRDYELPEKNEKFWVSGWVP